jgi:hypothetical protein
MRWTRAARLTGDAAGGRRSRVVLTPRCWRQVRERKLSLMTVARKPVTGKSAKEAVKTIARGMPGVFRCDLTNACAFYHTHCTRGYRAHRAPGIPCALVCSKSVRMCERAVGSEPPVAGTEPVAPIGHRACIRARDSSGVFLNPNSCKGFEPEPSKEGSG